MAFNRPCPHAGRRHAARRIAPTAGEKALYRVPEAMRLLSLSRSVIYNQIRVGRLHSVKQGKTRLIPADAITAYVSLLKPKPRQTDDRRRQQEHTARRPPTPGPRQR